MAKTKRGGLREPKGGRPPKPKVEKYRRRLITLPPETADKLDNWSLKNNGNISDLITQLLNQYFERIEK